MWCHVYLCDALAACHGDGHPDVLGSGVHQCGRLLLASLSRHHAHLGQRGGAGVGHHSSPRLRGGLSSRGTGREESTQLRHGGGRHQQNTTERERERRGERDERERRGEREERERRGEG